MSRFIVVLALAALAAGAAAPAQQPSAQQPSAEQPAASDDRGFANETEKGSYALGYNFGKTIQNRKMEVVADQVIAGMRDALSGGRARMSEQEITALARQIQNEGARRLQQERAALAAKNRAEGNAFLEANKRRAGVVTQPSGLQYEVLRTGDGPKPKVDDPVKVHFRGSLLDGTLFDTSERLSGPLVVRADRVIPAWTEALPMMSVGAKWKIFVPADLGYGDNVAAANVPPGATLIFEVELLSIEPKTEGEQAPNPWGAD